jgi:hypothetical protein
MKIKTKHSIIYKVLIYLQGHEKDNNGLTVIEGSHLERNIDTKNNAKKKIIHNKIGSIIIFDQRITHRGQYDNNGNNSDRILISLGFGKNNIFTKEFETGTIKRQNDQNMMITKRYR